ncbi:PAS domain-containing protein [Paraburkholderia sediminicola]|uniref:PAS domain-containing protein n=1 Tax=Paraburkholderia sediminicola TaxID=458836 RepID=UPI0038BB3CC6
MRRYLLELLKGQNDIISFMDTLPPGSARPAADADRYHEGFVTTLLQSSAPCALIDEVGAIVESNPPFDALLLPTNGAMLADRFQCSVDLPAASAGAPKAIHGTYRRESGERVPAVMHVTPLAGRGQARALIVMTDGGAFRQAEAQRFESTPCPILRVAVDGRITFANQETSKSFSLDLSELIGAPLSMLFDASFDPEVAQKVAACINRPGPEALDVTTSAYGRRGARPVHLVLTPDPAPCGKPLGALVVIQAATQTIRDKIRMIALEAEPNGSTEEPKSDAATGEAGSKFWKKQFDRILQQIHTLIDFDHANFGVYANDITLFHAEAMYPPDSPKWPARWMDLPPGIKDFVLSEKTWIPNVPRFVEENPKLLESEVVQCYLEFGVNSAVTLVVRQGDQATSALTLCSKEFAKYKDEDLKLLRELHLEPVLLRYEEKITAERQQFCDSIRAVLEKPGRLREAATKIVDEIASHFKWDYAGLFRVNRHRERFELYYQKESHPDFLMPANYQQPISNGMLASTLEADCVRIVDEIGGSCEQYRYVGGERGGPGRRNLKSAMTIPIHLNGRPRWVLNVECEASHAFRGPDEATLKGVILSVEKGLTHRMLSDMKKCLLEETDRGVVVVGTEGSIMELNETAEILLGRDEARCVAGSALLSEFAADDHSREVLEGLSHTSKRRIELNVPTGRNKVVLATRVDLDSSFDTSVWFLTDVEGVEWNRSIRFLRETVSDVAQQTRAPLALASLLARELPKMFGATGPKTRSVGAKARAISTEMLAEIGKADLTFERLAEAVSIRKNPLRVEERVDLLHCVIDVLDCLPERDRASIDARLPEECVYVSGDGGRIRFVVRSILGHLIRVRPDDSIRIEASLKVVENYAKLKLKLKVPFEPVEGGNEQSSGIDKLLAASQEAREAASLSLGPIRKIVRAHHGRLVTKADCVPAPDGSPRWISFSLSLPHA